MHHLSRQHLSFRNLGAIEIKCGRLYMPIFKGFVMKSTKTVQSYKNTAAEKNTLLILLLSKNKIRNVNQKMA